MFTLIHLKTPVDSPFTGDNRAFSWIYGWTAGSEDDLIIGVQPHVVVIPKGNVNLAVLCGTENLGSTGLQPNPETVLILDQAP